MSTTYNQVVVGDIDITDTFTNIMKAATGVDSVYLKAKETITAYCDNSDGLTVEQKATIVSQTLSEMAKSITAQSMEAAIKMDQYNQNAPYALTKQMQDTRLTTAIVAKTEQETLTAAQTLKNTIFAGWTAQASLYKDYGVAVWNNTMDTQITPSTSYTDYGTKSSAIEKTAADTANMYSGMYRDHGVVNYTIDAVTKQFQSVTADQNGLKNAQTRVAKRQEIGFDDNQRQHVVNSSATMLSMLLSTQTANIDYTPYLNLWTTASGYLNTSHDVVN